MSARQFLHDHPGGALIEEKLEAKGWDLDTIPAPEPLEKVWELGVSRLKRDGYFAEKSVIDAVAFREHWTLGQVTELIRMNLQLGEMELDDEEVHRLAVEFRENWTVEQIAEKLNLNLRGKEVDKDELYLAAGHWNTEIERLARRKIEEMNAAIDRAAQEGLVRVSPYTMPYATGEGEPWVSNPFASGATGAGGWAFAHMLDQDLHAAAYGAVRELHDAKNQRLLLLQEYVDSL